MTKVKGPPTKRPQIEDKKKPDPMADDSDTHMDVVSDYWPSSVGSGDESDPPATPHPKKGEADQVHPKKATTPKS